MAERLVLCPHLVFHFLVVAAAAAVAAAVEDAAAVSTVAATLLLAFVVVGSIVKAGRGATCSGLSTLANPLLFPLLCRRAPCWSDARPPSPTHC